MPAATLTKMYGSGMKAVMLVAGCSSMGLAGGMGLMSSAPYVLPRARAGYRLHHAGVIDHTCFALDFGCGIGWRANELVSGKFGDIERVRLSVVVVRNDVGTGSALPRAQTLIAKQDDPIPLDLRSCAPVIRCLKESLS